MLSIYKELRFTAQDCAVFPYIAKYQDLIDSWIKNNKLTVEILKRYILISFWLEYRADNHRGDNFAIDEISEEEYL